MRTISVQSRPSSPVASASPHSSSTVEPSTMGTPRRRASSSARWTSLAIRSRRKPWAKARVSTCLGNLSLAALLAPLETWTTSSSVPGSKPGAHAEHHRLGGDGDRARRHEVVDDLGRLALPSLGADDEHVARERLHQRADTRHRSLGPGDHQRQPARLGARGTTAHRRVDRTDVMRRQPALPPPARSPRRWSRGRRRPRWPRPRPGRRRRGPPRRRLAAEAG